MATNTGQVPAVSTGIHRMLQSNSDSRQMESGHIPPPPRHLQSLNLILKLFLTLLVKNQGGQDKRCTLLLSMTNYCTVVYSFLGGRRQLSLSMHPEEFPPTLHCKTSSKLSQLVPQLAPELLLTMPVHCTCPY